uniref:Peptidase S1 domain-containing protein n=1 Tax=Pelusios castaneus TaxID=367368 RepID=A0A8C8VLQ2_9SAUR
MAPLVCAVFCCIIGGQDAEQNKWPWQVTVQRNEDPICGGSLISALWVVSAGHCFDPLVLGVHHLLSPSAPGPSKVQQIICHPSYNAMNHVADITLVKLKESVPFIPSICPISLPGASHQFPEGSKCWVTGWRRVEVTSKSALHRLTQIMAPFCQALPRPL